MLLGFKQRFEAKILRKEKRHTIRAKRKRPPKVGEPCHCYVNPRQKSMRLLGRWPCIKVQDIRIKGFFHRYAGFTGGVFIDGEQILIDECEALARSDGFESFDEMMDFWRGRLPFHGDIIHWNPDRPAQPPRSRKSSARRTGPANK